MKIENGIAVLDLKMNLMGSERPFYPTILWDDSTVILVDAGINDTVNELKAAMKKEGVPFESVNKIILTHQDIDHIGGVECIVKELPAVEVLAHQEEIPYIEGEKKLVRFNSNLKDRISSLPETDRNQILNIFENTRANVDTKLVHGEKLAICGGITIIHTPGHTPGHICLYHHSSKTMIVGDAMNIMEGKLVGPNKQNLSKEDKIAATQSLKNLEKFDVGNVVCYHGGIYNKNPNQRIKELSRE